MIRFRGRRSHFYTWNADRTPRSMHIPTGLELGTLVFSTETFQIRSRARNRLQRPAGRDRESTPRTDFLGFCGCSFRRSPRCLRTSVGKESKKYRDFFYHSFGCYSLEAAISELKMGFCRNPPSLFYRELNLPLSDTCFQLP